MVKHIITQQQKLVMAKHIARAGGCFVVNVGTIEKNKWLVYREAQPRNELIGRRSSVDGLLSLVKQSTNFK